MNDTRPAPNPAPLLPDEAAWRRLSVQLARRAAALSEPLAVARLHHQRGEVERLELDDATAAQGSYERALDESPGFVPAELALRDLALSRDDPAAASTLFDRVVALPLLGGEARERAEFFESFLLAWLFRWRDPQKAVVCLRALEAMEPAPRLVRALEPLFVEAEVRRDRLRARFEESPPGAERAALGGALAMLLRDELDDGDTAYAVLDACADEDAMSAWLLCEAHAEAADAEGLVAALERLARLLPGSMAAALHHLCGELSEHRLGDPLRADVFYERSRGGTFHAAVSVRRVLQSLSGGARATQPGVSSADLLVRRYAEEAEALDELGLGRVFERLKAVGFDSLDQGPAHYGLGLALGNGEVRLLELTNAYRVLANGGVASPVRWQRDETPVSGERVLPRAVAQLLVDMLSDPNARAPAFGRPNALELPFDAFAKTGTSTDFTDNWTVGASTAVTVGVWVGNFDGRPMEGVSGITGAGRLWHRVMRDLHPGPEPAQFARDALAEREVCAENEPGDTRCTHRWVERFVPGTGPQPAPAARRKTGLRVVYPDADDVFSLMPDVPAEHARLHLRAELEGRPLGPEHTLRWEVDGAALPYAPGVSTSWVATPGRHRVRAWLEDPSGGGPAQTSDVVRFEVLPTAE